MPTPDPFPGEVPIVDRYGVTVPIASAYSGISKSRIYEFLQSGLLKGKKIGGRRIVLVSSLLRLCNKAPSTKHKRETARLEQSTAL